MESIADLYAAHARIAAPGVTEGTDAYAERRAGFYAGAMSFLIAMEEVEDKAGSDWVQVEAYRSAVRRELLTALTRGNRQSWMAVR